MATKLVILTLLLFDIFSNIECLYPIDGSDPIETAQQFGYKAQSYEVETTDGYILNLYRIGEGKGSPVLLFPGEFGNADEYFLHGANALPFLLANQGYDVFVGNSRGSKHCRHKQYTRDQREFWDFSFHEIGIFDIAAIFLFLVALVVTPIVFIGYSMGFSALLVLLALFPHYNNYLLAAKGQAPVAFISDSSSPFYNRVALFESSDETVASNIGASQFSPSPTFESNFKSILSCGINPICCTDYRFIAGGCNALLFLLASILQVLQLYPRYDISSKHIRHIAQLKNSGKFRQYDYHSPEKNLEKYGQAEPPEYDLSSVTVPTYIFHSDADILATPAGIDILKSKLPNVKNSQNLKSFLHTDFIFSDNSDYLSYISQKT